MKNVFHKNLGFFRFREIDGKMLLTNEIGEFVILKNDQWQGFIEKGEVADKNIQSALEERGFLKNKTDEDSLAQKFATKKKFLFFHDCKRLLILVVLLV